MKYSTSYRSLVANPRAKMSHKYRALLKQRERIEAKRTANYCATARNPNVGITETAAWDILAADLAKRTAATMKGGVK